MKRVLIMVVCIIMSMGSHDVHVHGEARAQYDVEVLDLDIVLKNSVVPTMYVTQEEEVILFGLDSESMTSKTVVMCLDNQMEVQWRNTYPGNADQTLFLEYVTVDEDMIVFVTSTGVLRALDHQGALLWSRDLTSSYASGKLQTLNSYCIQRGQDQSVYVSFIMKELASGQEERSRMYLLKVKADGSTHWIESWDNYEAKDSIVEVDTSVYYREVDKDEGGYTNYCIEEDGNKKLIDADLYESSIAVDDKIKLRYNELSVNSLQYSSKFTDGNYEYTRRPVEGEGARVFESIQRFKGLAEIDSSRIVGLTEENNGSYVPFFQQSSELAVLTFQEAIEKVEDVEPVISFNDIGHLSEEERRAIEMLASNNFISGRGDGVFDPDGSITRAEFAKIIVNVLGIENEEERNTFVDVKVTDWFYTYVNLSKRAGLINGYEDMTFKPYNVITKQEMVKICAASVNEKLGSGLPEDTEAYCARYSDPIAGWVKPYLGLAIEEGIIIPDEEVYFEGDKGTTRAKAALMVYRLYQLMD